MNQSLSAILQKLNSQDVNQQSPQRNMPSNPSSLNLSLMKPIKLEFPRFLGDDPASWFTKPIHTLAIIVRNME